MEYVLAVDGGGTKTHVWCADLTGRVVGEGLAGPTNLTATSVGAASLNLVEGIRQATQQLPTGWKIQKLAMGLAGVDTDQEIDEAKTVFKEALGYLDIAELTIVNDIVAALRSGTDKANAIAIIAGTGSNCFGQNADGQTAKVGGMDFLLTDEGSGYAIGLKVLHAAVKSFDGRREHSQLETLVTKYFQVPSVAELKNVLYHPLIGKAEIAQLTHVCAEAFANGDIAAKEIFDQTVTDLQEMIRTVATKLALTGKEVDCVLVGGVFEIQYISEAIQKSVQAICPQAHIIFPTQPPVAGALKIALQKPNQITNQTAST